MERSDRKPSLSGGASVGTLIGGAPGGAVVPQAQSATIRGPPENPPTPQSRRPSISSTNAPLPPIPMPPLPNARNAALPPLPNAAPTTPNSMTSAQIVGLVRDAMRHALESEGQAVEASGISPGLKSGVTIDLSRKGIHKLPEEVIDIVKNELERLALSHNQLSSLPARFVECTSLRYLNIRGNYIKEFPMPLCELSSLEILDLGRNQLRTLPPELSKLSSLKVLSIPKNQIRELPLCIADMLSLQVIKFEGNPISFPPREVLHPSSSARAANDATVRESDVNEIAVTAHIKKFLRLHAINGRDSETAGDDSSEGAETPRMPKKRLMSGRFPIRVNSTDKSDVRSPGLGIRPPPIPSRSHNRGLSQQNSAAKRPGVLPLTIGNLNERYRSNSESLLRFEKSEGRQRRMGLVTKKSSSDLTPLDETAANNRFSHYRGLSDGSAMQGGAAPAKSPATPTTENSMQRPVYVRRLSVLPERRRESSTFDPVIEAAKGILYSVFQIHPMIQMLMTLTNDGSSKRSSLELVFYNTNSHVEELEQAIQKHDTPNQDSDEPPSKDNANVHRACQTLVGAYGHVCTLLADNIETFVSNGDARYIRTLLMLIYNSIMELRVTLSSVSSQHRAASPMQSPAQDNSNTIRPYFREASAAHRPANSRGRNGNVTYTPFTKAMADMSAPSRPPRSSSQSNEAGTPPSSRDAHADFSDEDAQFDRCYLSLQASTDVVMQILPNFSVQLTGGIRNAMQQRAPAALIRDWRSLIALCNDTVQQTEVLKNQMSLIRLRDPSVRAQGSFWSLCSNFVASWTRMAYKIKAEINTIPLPPDTRMRLRPIHQSMKETSNIILQSPWHHFFRPSGPIGSAQGPFGQIMSPNQMSITPQSAALGPAMQATVATPQNASFASAFQGNVFDRADTLIANPGISMSRTGTMTRGHSGFNSLSSISSVSSDGVPTPSSAFSPSPAVQLGPTPFRLNGGKVAI